MKYLLIFLGSYAVIYFIVNAIVETRVEDMAEELRHRPGAPTPGQFLKEVQASARQSTREYTLIAGTLIALLVSVLVWWVTRR